MSLNDVKNTSFIIGGGIVGLESAIAAAENDKVILFDVSNVHSGSNGESRIVREDYPNQTYMKFAIEASKLWKADNEKFISTRGRYIAYQKNQFELFRAIESSRQHFGKSTSRVVDLESFGRTFGSQKTDDSLLDKDTQVVFEAEDFVVGWKSFFNARLEEATKCLVEVKEEEVIDLDINNNQITRIKTKTKNSQEKFYDLSPNDTCTIATGAWSQKLLDRWGIEIPEHHRPTPQAIISFEAELKQENAIRYINSVIGTFEYVPPIDHSGILKITWLEDKCIVEDEILSQPEKFEESSVMRAATHKTKVLLSKLIPSLSNLDLTGKVQFCSMSSAGVPVIAKHERITNLIMAINGNFTIAKLAPIMGQLYKNAIAKKPDFPMDPIEDVSHAQPALKTEKTFPKAVQDSDRYLEEVNSPNRKDCQNSQRAE